MMEHILHIIYNKYKNETETETENYKLTVTKYYLYGLIDIIKINIVKHKNIKKEPHT